MYQTLLFSHNAIRWLVLASLLYAIFRAYQGYVSKSAFSKIDNAVRHWTATIAHMQLLVGITLYFQSPITKQFWANFKTGRHHFDLTFFGLIHSSLMLTAIVLITIGSAQSKRKSTDREKFRTMLIWFLLALIILFLAIPWPFSPFANRPYTR